MVAVGNASRPGRRRASFGLVPCFLLDASPFLLAPSPMCTQPGSVLCPLSLPAPWGDPPPPPLPQTLLSALFLRPLDGDALRASGVLPCPIHSARLTVGWMLTPAAYPLPQGGKQLKSDWCPSGSGPEAVIARCTLGLFLRTRHLVIFSLAIHSY